jgi:hypothetical protein
LGDREEAAQRRGGIDGLGERLGSFAGLQHGHLLVLQQIGRYCEFATCGGDVPTCVIQKISGLHA